MGRSLAQLLLCMFPKPLHLLAPCQIYLGWGWIGEWVVIPCAKRGKGIVFLLDPLMEGCLLDPEVSCFTISMILRDGDKISGG
jgi:hypothetical protein